MAALLGAVILGLSSIYFLASRNQNARGRRFQGTVLTRYLSEGAVSLLSHLTRDYAHPTRMPPESVDPTRNLLELSLTPREGLEAAFEKMRRQNLSDRGDDRALLDRLLGKGVSDLLEALEATQPGAELLVHVGIAHAPFPDAPEAYRDSIPKILTLQFRAEALYGGARRVATGDETIVVYPLHSPLLGRFPGNAGYTWHESGASFPDEPFDTSRPDQRLVPRGGGVAAGNLAQTYEERGWVYPRHQVIAPGGGPGGLHHLLWLPESGKVPLPRSLIFRNPPDTFSGDFPPPGNPLESQQPLVEGLVQGGSGKIWIDGLAYPFTGQPPPRSPFEEDPVKYPPLAEHGNAPGPFGSTLDPSPTFAPGSRARVFAVSALTVDRQRTDEDEGQQSGWVGFELPFREAFGYLLPQLPPGPADYDPLEGPGLMETFPGSGLTELENRNRLVDRDGDGIPEYTVPSEIPHDPVQLITSLYSLAALFQDYESFRTVASRVVELPLNYVFHLSTLTAEEAQETLHRVAWSEGGLSEAMAWEELPYGLYHRDRVHTSRGVPEDALHYGSTPEEAQEKGEESGFLEHLGDMERFAASRWMPSLHVYGQKGLEKFFPDGNLRGLRVRVERATEKGASFVSLGGAYKAGWLTAGLIEVSGEIPAQAPGELLEISGNTVVVGDEGVSHLQIHAPSSGFFPAAPKAGEPSKLRGGVYLDTHASGYQVPSGDFEGQAAKVSQVLDAHELGILCTVWDEARDPLGEDAFRGYRISWEGLR